MVEQWFETSLSSFKWRPGQLERHNRTNAQQPDDFLVRQQCSLVPDYHEPSKESRQGRRLDCWLYHRPVSDSCRWVWRQQRVPWRCIPVRAHCQNYLSSGPAWFLDRRFKHLPCWNYDLEHSKHFRDLVERWRRLVLYGSGRRRVEESDHDHRQRQLRQLEAIFFWPRWHLRNRRDRRLPSVQSSRSEDSDDNFHRKRNFNKTGNRSWRPRQQNLQGKEMLLLS